MPSVDHIRRSLEGSFRLDHASQIIHARTSLDPADTEDSSDTNNEKMVDMMLVVLGLVFFALLLVSCLWVLRRAHQRRMQSEMLPSYYDAKRNHRGLTIETTHNGRASVLVIGRDGQPMLRSPNSPPHSPDNVPEIHITFPEEHDEHGRQKDGRVVVVRVGEASYGLEPIRDEQLPAYEKESNNGFYSIDMDKIGGLKEKDPSRFS
jgi:hypothetical protein